MKIDRKSIDYQVNIETLHEMEECIPMTLPERRALREWVYRGNDVESNPWDYRDGDGLQLNFLQAYRLKYGYSSGPWDNWKGPHSQPLWNNELKCFISKDDYC